MAEFRARWVAIAAARQDRVRISSRRKYWFFVGSILTVGILGRPLPALRFGPSPEFGERVIGSRSSEYFVRIGNSGLGALSIQNVRITGEAADDFSVSANDCDHVAVRAGRGCIVGLFFAPHQEGNRSARLVVGSDMGFLPGQLIVSGVGTARADFRVEPSILAFRDQTVGSLSEERATEVSSIARRSVRILGARIMDEAAEDFELGTNTCTEPLQLGNKCAVGVRFHPRVAGERNGRLELRDDTGDAPHEIKLVGRGATGDLFTDPELVSFSATQEGHRTGAESVTVRNSGTADVHVGSLTLAGEEPRDFLLDKGPCESASLRPNAACQVRVQFQPAGVGQRTATISIADDAPDGPHTVRLAGTGTDIERASAQIYAATYSFGRQPVNTVSKPISVIVVSRGSAPLRIGSIEFEGGTPRDFRLKTNCSFRTLQPKEQCKVDVSFTPAAAGETRAQVGVLHDASDAPKFFELDGLGFVPTSETSWCCAEGRFFEADEGSCKSRGGRSYPDAVTARKACASTTGTRPALSPETPSGLVPGSPLQTKFRAIACESLVLQWNPATAPGGYLVSVSRPALGTDTAVPPRLLFSSRVSTNEFHIPSPLEAGYYEWSVASLGLSGERSAAAAYNFILCAPRTNAPWKSTILSPARVKAGATVPPAIQ